MADILHVANPLPTTSLSFLQPDVIAYAYDLWVRGKHEDITHRTFLANFAIEEIRPFVSYGLIHVNAYLADWGFCRSDIEFLKHLPALSSFDEKFWAYLAALKFKGNIRAIPEGEVLGTAPVGMTEEFRSAYHFEGKSPWPLFEIEDTAIRTTLLSEAVFNILAESLFRSIDALKRKRDVHSPIHFYSASEQHIHPLYAMIESGLDIVLSNRPFRIFDQSADTVAMRWKIDQQESLSDEIKNLASDLREKHDLSLLPLFMT